MLRLIGLLVLLSFSFAAGYYAGQQPVGELRNTIATLTRTLLDTTTGIERTVRLKQGVVDAKERLIQAKSDLLDKNYGSAAKAMEAVVTDLERVGESGRDGAQAGQVRGVIAKARSAHKILAAGKPISRSRLDDIQKDLNGLTER